VIHHTHELFPHAVFALRTEKIYGCNESHNQFSTFEITIVVSFFLVGVGVGGAFSTS
jgi:hypothetical protein